MKRLIAIIAAGLVAFSAAQLSAQSTMTDQQVLTYVKEGIAAGKSRKMMTNELIARGVNRAQAERVKKLYEQQQGGAEGVVEIEDDMARSREHTPTIESAYEVDDLIADQIVRNEDVAAIEASSAVWGHNIFNSKTLTFSPSANLPTPRNYVLGPGDEVIIDIFGANQTSLRRVISPEGSINVDLLGPVYLNGKTIEAADKYLKQRLSAIYNGLNNEEKEATDIQLTLGHIRSVQINIVGESANQGTYMVNSLSTVYHALHQSGGVNSNGTVRGIKVVRHGKTVAVVDVYDFLLTGNRKNDIRMEEGDIVLIEPYCQIVKLNGYVKRAMNFELKEGETVSDLLRYAGGFGRSAYTGSLTVVRQSERDYAVFTVNSDEFSSFKLQDGDEVTVSKLEARFENRVSVKGSVYMSGIYQLGNDIRNVRQLIAKAGGLLPEAFQQHAVLYRERPDRSLEVLPVDVEAILNGSKPDIELRKNDELFIPSIYDLNDRGTLTIEGEVATPGTFPYADNVTLEDLIIQAGGLLRSASVVRVDVNRKVVDSSSLHAKNDISELFTFPIREDFSIDGASNFVLQPYDIVHVRRSPSYVESKFVNITGEVNFPGSYVMSKREERVSDLVAKAGNISDYAYVHGARLWRKMNATELEQLKRAVRSMRVENDSVFAIVDETYLVALDLEKALANPGGEYDLVLREGDRLDVPVLNNTVHVNGAVQMPNVVVYSSKMSKNDYIKEAGGYLKSARKSKAFVVYMNGHVKPLKRSTKIEPGCEIYVPMKKKKQYNVAQGIGILSSLASLGTMTATLVNLLR